MRELTHNADFCVVGGGIAGMCAAVAAARNGLKTILIQDRPVPGGNASSEIRMWICGAHGENNRESGLVEELLLENLARNPEGNYSLWDSVLYGFVRFQPNLTVLLNTTCIGAAMNGSAIDSVRCWEMNAETWHTVHADYFCDCSGDGILAPLTGAEFRQGREGSAEFGEDTAPAEADRKTMGLSCLIQARETAEPHSFTAPAWANHYTSFDQFPNRGSLDPDSYCQNYWWIECGGSGDALHESAANRDTLLKVCLGVWALVKNHPETAERFRNWELEWMGFFPGKRESRRLMGDWIMTADDVRSGGKFPDTVAYGGWSMDDHHPDGIDYPGAPTTYHAAPSPYGIPYRTLYSRNIGNLFFAGRNISVTHSALSSTRVMATCGTLGQAVGTAAALAGKYQTTPRGVYEKHLHELQQTLMRQDAWLPGFHYEVAEIVASAALNASNGQDVSGLRLGLNRIVGGVDRSWHGAPGDSVTYTLKEATATTSARIVLDSNLSRERHNLVAMRPLKFESYTLPPELAKSLRLEVCDAAGTWTTVWEDHNNSRRLIEVPVTGKNTALRLTVLETWGNPEVRVFAFDFQ